MEIDDLISFRSNRTHTERVASHLRSQIVTLHNVLETIERTNRYQDEYVMQAIKTVEKELNRLRKFIDA